VSLKPPTFVVALFGAELYQAFAALEIDPANRPADTPDIATYHPTFLYESLWCVGVLFLLIWAEQRFRLGYGRLFAPYVAVYTLGRVWVEALRVDHANRILGLRLNIWTSIIIFAAAVAFLLRARRGQPASVAGTQATGGEPPAGDSESPGEDRQQPVTG
jgi:prolipoprotein diacylglyceryltransferase